MRESIDSLFPADVIPFTDLACTKDYCNAM